MALLAPLEKLVVSHDFNDSCFLWLLSLLASLRLSHSLIVLPTFGTETRPLVSVPKVGSTITRSVTRLSFG